MVICYKVKYTDIRRNTSVHIHKHKPYMKQQYHDKIEIKYRYEYIGQAVNKINKIIALR